MHHNHHAFLITAYRDPMSLLALLQQICEIPYAKAFLAVDLNQDSKFLRYVDHIS